MTKPNFKADAEKASANADQTPLVEAVNKAIALSQKIKKREQMVKDNKAELQTMVREEIPSIMKQMQTKKIILEISGFPVTVTTKGFLAGSIPSQGAITKASGEAKAELEERLKACLSWLEAHNGASLIKGSVSVEFGKGEGDKAKELTESLVEDGFKVENKRTVHHKALTSFLTEVRSKGIKIPDVFKPFEGEEATIKIGG